MHVDNSLDCDDGDVCTVNKCSEGFCTVTESVEDCCNSHDDCLVPTHKCDLTDNVCVAVSCITCGTNEDCGPEGNVCLEFASGLHCAVNCSDHEMTCPEATVCEEPEQGIFLCIPEDGDCECVEQAAVDCVDGDVHWTDSCGNPGALIEECGDRGCLDGECCPEGQVLIGNECVPSTSESTGDAGSGSDAADVGAAESVITQDTQTGNKKDVGKGGGSGGGGCSAVDSSTETTCGMPVCLIVFLGIIGITLLRNRKWDSSGLTSKTNPDD